jgi:hypothetical protein
MDVAHCFFDDFPKVIGTRLRASIRVNPIRSLAPRQSEEGSNFASTAFRVSFRSGLPYRALYLALKGLPMSGIHQHEYISANAAWEQAENQHASDADLQSEADSSSESGQAALDAAAAHHAHGQAHPDQGNLANQANVYDVVNMNEADDLEMLSEVQQAVRDETAPLRRDLDTEAALRRRQVKILVCVNCALGLGVVVGGLMLGLYLAGLLDASKQPPAADVDKDGDGDGDDKDGKPGASGAPAEMVKVSAETLNEWNKLDNASLFKTISDNAFAKGKEWSYNTWAYVTGFLSILTANMAANGRIDNFSSLLVSDTTLQADFDDWHKNQELDIAFIFNKSANYPPSGGTPPPAATSVRGVRLDYLARIFAKAVDTIEDES